MTKNKTTRAKARERRDGWRELASKRTSVTRSPLITVTVGVVSFGSAALSASAVSASSSAATTETTSEDVSPVPISSAIHCANAAAFASPAATRITSLAPPFSRVGSAYHTIGLNPSSSMHRGPSCGGVGRGGEGGEAGSGRDSFFRVEQRDGEAGASREGGRDGARSIERARDAPR